jgi:hypothetical protein
MSTHISANTSEEKESTAGANSVHNEEEDDGSSSAGSKRSSTQDTDNSPNGDRGNVRLASDETRAVFCSKILMVLVLLGVAAAAAVTVFKYTTNQVEEDFEIRVSRLEEASPDQQHSAILRSH